jgi:hypothetical protein
MTNHRQTRHMFFLASGVVVGCLWLLFGPIKQQKVATWTLDWGDRPIEVAAWCVPSRGYDLQLRLAFHQQAEFARLTIESSLDVPSDCKLSAKGIEAIRIFPEERLLQLQTSTGDRFMPIWIGSEISGQVVPRWESCLASYTVDRR